MEVHSVPTTTTPQINDNFPIKENPFGVEVKPTIEAPPSMYQGLNNKTLIGKELGVEDNDNSFFIEKFINTLIKIEDLNDSRATFNKVFDRLITKIGLSRDHNPSYLLEKLYLYLSGNNIDAQDDLALNILTTREKKRGR